MNGQIKVNIVGVVKFVLIYNVRFNVLYLFHWQFYHKQSTGNFIVNPVVTNVQYFGKKINDSPLEFLGM